MFGLSYRKIAARVGRSHSTCHRLARHLRWQIEAFSLNDIEKDAA